MRTAGGKEMRLDHFLQQILYLELSQTDLQKTKDLQKKIYLLKQKFPL